MRGHGPKVRLAEPLNGLETDRMTRFLVLLLALTISVGCGYVQMQPKSGDGGPPAPAVPRLP
jgi:hypothetical protein